MLELACTELNQICSAHEREHDICGETLRKVVLDAERTRGVEQYACVLRRNDRLDDVGQIIDVWQGFDAEEDVVEGLF